MTAYIDKRDLDAAELYLGRVPWYLMDKDKIAITRGTKIYFRPGEYDVTSKGADGLPLLGHELVHVGQYRQGMNWFTYLLRSKRFETPAEAMQNKMATDFMRGGFPGCWQ